MFRAAPRTTTSLVRRSEACRRLAIGMRVFWQRWHSIFTDPRDPEDRRPGVERKVYSDELDIAVEFGGGQRARTAVLNYRGQINRKESA
jgi:hypothetical protein